MTQPDFSQATPLAVGEPGDAPSGVASRAKPSVRLATVRGFDRRPASCGVACRRSSVHQNSQEKNPASNILFNIGIMRSRLSSERSGEH